MPIWSRAASAAPSFRQRFDAALDRADVTCRCLGPGGSSVSRYVAYRRKDRGGMSAKHLFERLFHWFARKDATSDPINLPD
ncbi:MAG: hypothetical protein GDA49_04560 [Rhodospirillales bacterium]|nr:hypothetical protein [Rhodospirillales bacterium]